jgi:uncharacterized protein
MRIFVDTSAFYALLDGDDQNHPRAKTAWTDILGNENTLITSNYVLIETIALLQNRLGMEAVRGFQEDILPLVNIEFVGPELHRSGMSAHLAASRRTISFVDCVSFDVMRHLGLKTALAFDSHFQKQGFRLVP